MIKKKIENNLPQHPKAVQENCIHLKFGDLPLPNGTKYFIEDVRLFDKIQAIAYWEKISVTSLIHNCIRYGVRLYEHEKGPIKYIPEEE